METTLIQLKKKTAYRLQKLKRYGRQSYDEVINQLLDNPDDLTLDDIEAIKAGIADIKAGRVVTQEQLAKELGIKL
jgi:predicted transcriptional regulator